MRNLVLAAALPLALAACNQAPADNDEADAVATGGEVDAATGTDSDSGGDRGADTSPAPTATVTATPTASPTPTPTATATDAANQSIPVALQGRWALVPADCTSTRGDAKGLMTVAPTTLRFYESLARLGTIQQRSARSIRAQFSYTGEGMTWSRIETLSVSGNKLTRTQRGGDEPGSGGPFTYTKC
ncbi:hypothetical protein ACWPMX_03210 [Tsuneonella sp. HG094]